MLDFSKIFVTVLKRSTYKINIFVKLVDIKPSGCRVVVVVLILCGHNLYGYVFELGDESAEGDGGCCKRG